MDGELVSCNIPHKFTMDETSRVWMSVDDEKEMSNDREHLLKKRSMLDAKSKTKHLLKRWILIEMEPC